MKIGMRSQQDRETIRQLRADLFTWVCAAKTRRPGPQTDDLIVQTLLNFCLDVLVSNGVNRQLAVQEFDKKFQAAQQEANRE